MLKIPDMLSALVTSRSLDSVVGWRNGKPIFYDELLARTQAWYAHARQLEGRAYALYIADTIDFAAALFGAWYGGKIVILAGDVLPATCANLCDKVDGFLGEFPSEWEPSTPSCEENRKEIAETLDPKFFGIALYTSGSAGAPQAIIKKLGQLATEVTTLEQQFGSRLGNAAVVATVSHQHIYGLLFKVLWPLSCGRTIHAGSLTFLDEIAGLPVGNEYVLVSTPAHLKRLPENPVLASGNWPKAVFSSGGPLSFEIARLTEQSLRCLPIEVYGSSETGGIAWRQQRTREETWTTFPNVDWRIESTEGLLEIHSPNLPDDNWFRTADRVV